MRACPIGGALMEPRESLAEITAETLRIRQYNELLERRADERRRLVANLGELWAAHAGTEWVPADHVFAALLFRYPVEIVDAAVLDVAVKVAGGYVRTEREAWLRYLHAVARNMAEGR